MKISVIIPTFKPDTYLQQCLLSVYNQTIDKAEYEVILVLNGCCEPWKGQIEAFIHESLSGLVILFIQSDVSGVSNARNIGIKKARGEYLTFLDDDDYVSPDYLQELLIKASDNTVSVSNTLAFSLTESAHSYLITDAYNRIKNKGAVSINESRSFFSGPCMKLIHKSIIGSRLFNPKLTNGEDTLFMFEISNKIKHVAPAAESAIYYRRVRDGSATTRKRSKMEKRKSNMIQLIYFFKCFVQHPFSYNYRFSLVRCLGFIYYIIKPL